jgi:hypothetical protein
MQSNNNLLRGKRIYLWYPGISFIKIILTIRLKISYDNILDQIKDIIEIYRSYICIRQSLYPIRKLDFMLI